MQTFFENFFVIQLKKLNELAEPIILLLRLCDGDTPCAGKVYHKVFQLGEELSNFEGLSVVQKREVTTLFTSRWDMMYSDMHGAGHALDPEYQVGGYWVTFTSLSFVPYFFFNPGGGTTSVVLPPPFF